MAKKQQGNIVAIIVMIFLFGMISFVTNLASPMGDILKYYLKSQTIEIPNWMSTLGVFANFIAYAVMGYPAGNLLQKLGYKKTALIAITVGFVGIGIQTIAGTISGVSAFGIYITGAFVAGFSMCLLNTVVNPMLNSLGGRGNKGNQLIQIGGSFNSLCGTTVIILTGILIPSITEAKISQVFPLMFAALAIFAFAFIVIWISAIPEKQKEENQVANETSMHSPLSFRHFILGAIGIFVYVGVEVGIPNLLQKWLQNPDINILKGNAEAIAGSVAGTYWLLMLVGRLIGAAIGGKVSAKSMLCVASTVGILLTLGAIFAPTSSLVNLPVFKNGADGLFGFAEVPINAALLVFIGLCTSVMWGGIFNLAVEGLGKYTEKAAGFFMVLVCGGGILPLLQNGIVDITGDYLTSYWVIVIGLAYLLYYALVGSKNINKDIPVE